MRHPMVAIPAITDEDVPVKNPANLVLVEIDPKEVAKLFANAKQFGRKCSTDLLTISFECCDHEFVQTFEPAQDDADEMSPEAASLGYTLDDLATDATSIIRVDRDIVHELRTYGCVKDCHTDNDLIELSITEETIRLRGQYTGKKRHWCSSRSIPIEEFLEVTQS